MSELIPIQENKEEFKKFDYSSIYRSKAFTEAMNTYFDNSDNKTRNVLLAVNEADQNTVMVSLANRLYAHIVEKIDDIDFGTIPNSKGDITKVDNYDKLVDCVGIITEILQQYHQDVTPASTISLAISAPVSLIESEKLCIASCYKNIAILFIRQTIKNAYKFLQHLHFIQ